jgi:hypothetical protein
MPRGATERLTATIVYQGPLMAPVQEGAEVARLRVYRGSVLALDAQHFGADRAWLLRQMLTRSPGWVIEEGGRIVAAVLGRDGTRWRQAGPLWAEAAPQAQALLAAALPDGGIADLRDGQAFLPWLEAELAAPMRPFTRMVLGEPLPPMGPACVAVLGPEFG